MQSTAQNTTCEFCSGTYLPIENINGVEKANYFCPACGGLNSLIEVNYFTYFFLNPEYPVDKKVLEEHYLQLFTLYHSDNFVINNNPVINTQKQQLNAVNHSAYLNKAYATLKHDLKSLAYYYELVYQEPIVEHIQTINDPAFNVYFFELNEELDNLLELHNVHKLAAYKIKIDNFYTETMQNTLKNLTKKNTALLKQNYIKLLYIARIKERLK